MKFFKNKKQLSGAASDKAANCLALGLVKVQGYWTKGMNKLYNKLSLKWKKVTLISACVLMVFYSMVVIAFSLNKATSLLAKPTAAIQPLSIVKPSTPMPVGVPAYLRRIKNYKNYLDSLSHTPDGRRVRDSILERRPGLLDSISRIEIIYCQK